LIRCCLQKKQKNAFFGLSLITATLIAPTGEPAGAHEAGHQADSPHPRLVLRGEEPQSLRDKLNRARKYCTVVRKLNYVLPIRIVIKLVFQNSPVTVLIYKVIKNMLLLCRGRFMLLLFLFFDNLSWPDRVRFFG
jgi:hypothetical protein